MEAIALLRLFEQSELFVTWRIVGDYTVSVAVMYDPCSTDIFDDGGVAGGILDCEMDACLVEHASIMTSWMWSSNVSASRTLVALLRTYCSQRPACRPGL